MSSTFPRMIALASPLLLAGCISPFNTRFPNWCAGNMEVARREFQVQDPFPDDRMGPPTGFRPLGYQNQRSEPQVAKDRFYGGFQRSQIAPVPAVGYPPQQMMAVPPGVTVLPPGVVYPPNAMLPPNAVPLPMR